MQAVILLEFKEGLSMQICGKVLLVGLLFVLNISHVFASGFRCGNTLVMEGDTTAEVKIKCGTPFDIQDVGFKKIKNEFVKITRYTYVPEKGGLIRILEFQSGILKEIKLGSRVE
ncbi:MAG: hypothetical protein ACI9O6_003531 [Glaciecola sp.]|jgi:hypothetical protein|mmetsp:Transcript_68873/g.217781  ORF Transcript_68873/g.217781 Transcript_68873/m.217781 type:complete len:115 (+) Transcript_68873:136-480(+)